MQGNYSVQIRGPCSVRAMKKYLVDLVTFRGLGTQQDCDIASTSACRLTILTLYFIEPFVSTSNCKIMRMSTLRCSITLYAKSFHYRTHSRAWKRYKIFLSTRWICSWTMNGHPQVQRLAKQGQKKIWSRECSAGARRSRILRNCGSHHLEVTSQTPTRKTVTVSTMARFAQSPNPMNQRPTTSLSIPSNSCGRPCRIG